MSDNPQPTETQAVPIVQPQAGDDKTQAVESISIDKHREVQREAQNLRTRLKAFEDAEKQRQQAELSEAQRLKVQLDELSGTHTAALAELRSLKAQALARDAGALYPDLVADKLSDEVLNGDKQTRDRAIERLRTQYPTLFRVGTADGNAGRDGVATPATMNDLIRRAAGRG